MRASSLKLAHSQPEEPQQWQQAKSKWVPYEKKTSQLSETTTSCENDADLFPEDVGETKTTPVTAQAKQAEEHNKE